LNGEPVRAHKDKEEENTCCLRWLTFCQRRTRGFKKSRLGYDGWGIRSYGLRIIGSPISPA